MDIGVDPLEETTTAETYKKLYTQKKNLKHSIGDLLLEQNLICGIGNIYRSEILHRASILPDRLPLYVSDEEWEQLACDTKYVLTQAISFGGSSVSDFVNPQGEKGLAQTNHAVYGRAGLLCMTCQQAKVQVEIMTKRKIFFCRLCQF
jgi:formamidopyrimidine-DNA glycosylase